MGRIAITIEGRKRTSSDENTRGQNAIYDACQRIANAARRVAFGHPRPGHNIRRCCPVGFGNEGEDGREVIVFDFSATYTATIRKRRVQGERIIRNPHGEEAVGELERPRAISLDDV